MKTTLKNTTWVIFYLFILVNAEGSAQGFKSVLESKIKAGRNTLNLEMKGAYEPFKVIVKVNEKFRSSCGESGINESKILQAEAALGGHFVKIFPGKTYNENAKTKSGLKPVDISLLYCIQYRNDISVEMAASMILKTAVVDFAEPAYMVHEMYTPNDTSNVNQYYLSNINAFNAYDLEQGDTSMVIGITDSGVNTAHVDLKGNIAYNYADPLNGMDDDQDGFVDNFMGWDLGTNSNNPLDTLNHGTGVAGIAAASTDNITGMTGIGFKSRFLPIKVSSGNTFNKAYEGIVYAADHGCKVINCSWGGTGGGNYGQIIVDYAAINMDAVVVASAGNSNTDVPFYPASYEHVLSVSSVNSSDIKTSGSSGSSYGYGVDIAAPGSGLFTTRYDGTYTNFNGTSAAAPVISGCAAILRTHFPAYNALQVAEQLRITSDAIDAIPGNSSFTEKLGKGRANLFTAVSSSAEAVRMSQLYYADQNDQILMPGDTINISGLFTNYLMPANALKIGISSSSTHVILIDSVINVGAMSTMGTYNNINNPFRIQLTAGLAVNEKINIRFSFSDGTYSDYQYAEITVNADYINIAVNEISTTLNSRGCFGYSVFPQTDGLGFDYKGNNLLFAGGLMIGNSSTAVSDNVYGSNINVADNDFLSLIPTKKCLPSVVSDFDVAGEFNDNGATNKLNVSVKQNAYAWSSAGNRKFIILKYQIKNNNLISLNNVFAGLFADWDILNYANNKASVDAAHNLAYAFSTGSGGLYAGIQLLSPGNLSAYMDDNDGSAGGILIYDGFTSAEKYKMLSVNRSASGVSGLGSDISMTLGSGPYAIASGDSIVLAFALIAGDSLQDIQKSAQDAQIIYNSDIATSSSTFKLERKFNVFPNPVNDKLYFNLPNGKPSGKGMLEISDVLGRKVLAISQYNLSEDGLPYVPVHLLNPGMYVIQWTTENGQTFSQKFVVERK